jgi:hypothetical protein
MIASTFVAGHRGLVGSAVVHRLQSVGYGNLVLRSRAELDLCSPTANAHSARRALNPALRVTEEALSLALEAQCHLARVRMKTTDTTSSL